MAVCVPVDVVSVVDVGVLDLVLVEVPPDVVLVEVPPDVVLVEVPPDVVLVEVPVDDVWRVEAALRDEVVDDLRLM